MGAQTALIEPRRRTDLIFLALLFGIVYLQFLGRVPLLEPDEGRYAEISREMLESGDFLTPFLNYVHYFEKPPLLYWMNAFSMKLLGQNEFAVRLPCALFGVLTILFVYHLGRTLFGRREGLAAALILGSSLGFMVQSRLILTDIPLTFFLTTALGCFILATREGENRAGLYYYLFYFFAALAVLAKGLIGIVLPGGVVFFYILLTGRWRLLREMRLPAGLLLFLAISVPWFVRVSLKNPEFARFFFLHEHIQRFLTKAHSRYQPFWYFIPILLVGLLPWSLLIPSSFRGVWRARRERGGEARLFLAVWFVLIFLFFSISNSKLIPYILPVYPAAALLIGEMMVRTMDGQSRPLWIPVRIMAGLMMILGIAVAAASRFLPEHVLSGIAGALIGGLLFIQGLVAALAAKHKNPVILLTGLTGTALMLMLAGLPLVLNRVAERKSCRSLGQAICRLAPPNTAVVSQGVRHGLSFYAHRRIIIAGGSGELEFGSRLGDHRAWFIDNRQFSALWDSDRPVFAVINKSDLPEFQATVHAPARIHLENRKNVLISNKPQ